MGVIHDQTLSVGGIAASVLEYLVSRGRKPRDRAEGVKSLKEDLVNTMYESWIDEDQPMPLGINLSQTDRERAQSLFAASLQYDGMVDRESRITRAHESTFRWILQENQPQGHHLPMIRWSSFRAWLESDDQIYWIAGKAGSGKSTLMKFLGSSIAEMLGANDAQKNLKQVTARERCRCHPYLEKWADPLGLVVASFYFWNSGTELQTTQAGLLRTLLHQVVVQRPDILPTIAPRHWELLCLFESEIEIWSAPELHDLLFRALKTLSNNSKICLFIDGLDEFGHNHDDLISMT